MDIRRSRQMPAAIVLVLLFAVFIAARSADAQTKTVEAKNGVVVSVSAPASEVGLAMLKRGGNAVDAAVATAFALAVTFPQAGNIGGGGFMVVHPAQGPPVVVEYRETAPAAATATMFAKKFIRYGPKVVGTPGTVRGMALAHTKFGKLRWQTLVQPAVVLAEKGFVLDKYVARSLNGIMKKAKNFPELRRVFGRSDGKAWQPGDRLVQPDLAKTLRHIANEGPKAFYNGVIANQLVAEMQRSGGLITHADLAKYRAQLRDPIHATFRGHDVYGPPPPSSGGISVALMLNILENYPLKKWGRYAPKTMHVMTEAMRRAYCDRARHLGDTAFVKIPLHLTSKDYGRKLAGAIDLKKATRSEDLAREIKLSSEGDSTTHFSIIDKDGMAVSNTYTLEHSYGSLVVVKGAGFLLNNEMLDFNRRPGWTDRKGNIGTKPNLIAPGKKMLSSQTPIIVAKNGKVVLVTGSPGGRTIINTSLCMILNTVEFGMSPQHAMTAPRHHHQWFPDVLRFEGATAQPALVQQLRGMGHQVEQARQGDAHSIWVDAKTGRYIGVADQRLSGAAAGW